MSERGHCCRKALPLGPAAPSVWERGPTAALSTHEHAPCLRISELRGKVKHLALNCLQFCQVFNSHREEHLATIHLLIPCTSCRTARQPLVWWQPSPSQQTRTTLSHCRCVSSVSWEENFGLVTIYLSWAAGRENNQGQRGLASRKRRSGGSA